MNDSYKFKGLGDCFSYAERKAQQIKRNKDHLRAIAMRQKRKA